MNVSQNVCVYTKFTHIQISDTFFYTFKSGQQHTEARNTFEKPNTTRHYLHDIHTVSRLTVHCYNYITTCFRKYKKIYIVRRSIQPNNKEKTGNFFKQATFKGKRAGKFITFFYVNRILFVPLHSVFIN